MTNFRFFGFLNISKVTVKGLSNALKENLVDKRDEYRLVKVHFKVDRFGLIQVVKADAYILKFKEGWISSSKIILYLYLLNFNF